MPSTPRGSADHRRVEVRVLDQADHVPEWVGHRRNLDVAADVLHGRYEIGASADPLTRTLTVNGL